MLRKKLSASLLFDRSRCHSSLFVVQSFFFHLQYQNLTCFLKIHIWSFVLLRFFVLSRFKYLFSKKKDQIDQMSKLHTFIASIVTDCSKMRVDIMELVISVNSVLNDEYKHLDNGSTNNCVQDSAQGNKNLSADVW
jgi:hypothetical protein